MKVYIIVGTTEEVNYAQAYDGIFGVYKTLEEAEQGLLDLRWKDTNPFIEEHEVQA